MYDVEHKRQVLIKQSQKDSENYYRYLKALYNLFLQNANEQNRDYATGISFKKRMSVITDCYDKAYVSPDIVIQYQRDLSRLGYISIKKVNGETRFYIIRELDF